MQVQCCVTPLDVECGLSTPALSEILRHTYRFVSDYGQKTCQLGFSLGGCIRYSSVAFASAGAPAGNAEAETVVDLSEALSSEHLSVLVLLLVSESWGAVANREAADVQPNPLFPKGPGQSWLVGGRDVKHDLEIMQQAGGFGQRGLPFAGPLRNRSRLRGIYSPTNTPVGTEDVA
ncbi:hypothetical protein CDV31_013417 [Fusarium ambrosium]|uniref:Uncharacterized protein n=1 Tax=Fusarium ambrosium TaxID=131363 RepID=A0A428T3E6_9HYPO|nr:hypothetical protein CDV31_013417 [Fusarium ambrosium]